MAKNNTQGTRFPTPAFAGVTSIWRIYQCLRYKHYAAIHDAHQALGTHVRIAPNHRSISDPTAVAEIYGHGANFLKDAWYDGGAGEHRHMSDERVKTEHQRKRKLLSHVFAQKSLSELEPVIADTISTLMAQIKLHAQEQRAINMRYYFNYFTIDVFSKMLYSRSLGCLERGDDMVDAQTPEGKVYKVPFIQSLLYATHINTILGMEAGILAFTRKMLSWHPYKKSGADFDNIILHNTKLRMSAVDDKGDIFSKLLAQGNGEPVNLPFGELLAECSVMMNAGTETTTAALTNAIYLLFKNPHVLCQVRRELDYAFPSDTVLSYDTVSKLPFLKACIEESLRVRPASSMGLPQVVPKGGRMIAGHFINEDVTVSVPTYTLLRDPNCFESAEQYDPQRWISDDKVDMTKAHLPFSTEPRACIGRNIAYYE
ncbi:cytochrome P450 [Thelonectria olida]|uniref:Cytochrome P450 n=1 Tax=Thelonectria olida TaxID=1576542 RepID=A0A9P9AL90_9HYPO|nr:cytochrome P450 [Thelonectria olida]